MSKKTVLRADLIDSSCKMAILSTVAKLEGIKSMDIDNENCTLTVIGTVDPVAIVVELKKKRLEAVIISVEDDKPKDPEPAAPEPEPTKENDPCHCREACVQACVETCEKGCVPGCYCSPCVLPNCCYYTAFRPTTYGYGGTGNLVPREAGRRSWRKMLMNHPVVARHLSAVVRV